MFLDNKKRMDSPKLDMQGLSLALVFRFGVFCGKELRCLAPNFSADRFMTIY